MLEDLIVDYTALLWHSRRMDADVKASSSTSSLSSSVCLKLATMQLILLMTLGDQHGVTGVTIPQNFTMSYPSAVGTIVGTIGLPGATPPFVQVYFGVLSDSNYFNVSLVTGLIKVASVIDPSVVKPVYQLLAVTAQQVWIQVNIYVNVISMSVGTTPVSINSPPLFTPPSILLNIVESTPVNTSFYLGTVSDPNSGLNGIKLCQIVGNPGPFKLVTSLTSAGLTSVSLVVAQTLDYETSPGYSLTVRAYDGGTPSLYGDQNVTVLVVDVNDNSPVFTAPRYTAQVAENIQQGTSVVQVSATDKDSGVNGMVTYTLDTLHSSTGAGDFSVDPTSGVVRVAQPLNYYIHSVYDLVIIAMDGGVVPLQASCLVVIQVTPIGSGGAVVKPTISLSFLSDDGSAKVSRVAATLESVAFITVTGPGNNNKIFIYFT